MDDYWTRAARRGKERDHLRHPVRGSDAVEGAKRRGALLGLVGFPAWNSSVSTGLGAMALTRTLRAASSLDIDRTRHSTVALVPE
jgi:hypothetical protein